ncbi:anti-sigma factor family protein [Thiohalomonas denitrificans]|uniref:anti-sigma factor family protein n=1 Tax=Thiohalomonas denitrificans TaxID=415747 RepID=UPI0026EE6DA3|nr:zf-HC2 domain-containing protein [Thiohalomonas denitrificans]
MDFCPKIEMLSAYVDGELSSAAMFALDEHVANCARCRETVSAIHLLGSAVNEDGAPPVDLVPEIMERIKCERDVVEVMGMGWRRWSPISLSAAAGIMLAIGVLLGHGVFYHSASSTDPLVGRMWAFDLIPPGGVCIHNNACFGVRAK